MNISATVNLTFVTSDSRFEYLIDQQTGEIDLDLLADALTAHLGKRESHSLQVTSANWKY